MGPIIESIFWISCFVIFWANLGYYLFLRFASLFYSKETKKSDYTPGVSLIITAHNEEKRIDDKIRNTLELNYPKDKLEIILVSDGSTDRTVEIASLYRDRGLTILEIPSRRGKHYGQGEALKIARNEIAALTDATTFLEPDSIRNIVANFADDTIGCVSGIDKIRDPEGGHSGEGAYVKYEMKLRDLESRVGSLVGASGSFYAFRKFLAENWYPDMSGDFFMPLNTRIRGYRTILDTTAAGYYKVIGSPEMEFRRKVRTVVHGIDVLIQFRRILNPFKYGLFSIQIISHKLMRWLVPFALILAFLANIFAAIDGQFYRLILYLQAVFYGLGAAPHFIKGLQRYLIFRIPFFFVMANLSILIAWIEFARGERHITWQSTKR